MVPSNQKIRWGIVGLGKQAENIASAIRASSNGELVAVASKDKKRAKQFAELYGAKNYFASYTDVLKLKEVRAVCVSSPNYEHAKQAIRAAEAGKHVLCEKPMALNTREAREMIKVFKKRRVTLGIGYHLRQNPAFQKTRDIVISGALGKIVLIQMNWSVGNIGKEDFAPYRSHMAWRNDPKLSGGGALTARGVHLFDLARFITDEEVTEVAGWADTDLKKPVDTLVAGLLKTNSSEILFSTGRRIPYAINDLVVYGSKGRLFVRDAFRPDGLASLEWKSSRNVFRKKYPKDNLYRKEIEDFGKRILGEKTVGADERDGLMSVAIMEALIKSVKEKKTTACRS